MVCQTRFVGSLVTTNQELFGGIYCIVSQSAALNSALQYTISLIYESIDLT